jgi:hypothetical protein
MNRRFVTLVLMVGVLMAVPALGQELMVSAKDTALSCLTSTAPGAKIEFPSEAMERRMGAQVKLRLRFDKPDSAPRVDVLANSGGSPMFADLALRHARNYRLPCLAAGVEQDATQVFSFLPRDDRPIVWGEVTPNSDRLAQCVTRDGESLPWSAKPQFPVTAMRRGLEGVVLARMVFSSPSAPAEVSILFDGGHPEFGVSVSKFLQDVRLACLHPGETFTASSPFHFRMSESKVLVLKDMQLAQFVGAIDPEALKQPAHQVRFDLSAMGCPFEVRLGLYQPYQDNTVGEIGASDPRREPLLRWLGTVPLALDKTQLKRVLGQYFNIAVPCGTLNLT